MPIILTLSTCHILSIYKSLNYIHDPLLNINRCHILLKEYVENEGGMNTMLTKPDDITKNEKLLGWKKLVGFKSVGIDVDTLRYKVVDINKRLDECLKNKNDIIEMIDFYDKMDTKYWIMIRERNINIWYKQEAENKDLLESMLAVGYLQFDTENNYNDNYEEDIGLKYGLLENAVRFAKTHNSQWMEFLQQSEWNIDNLFIEIEANRIQY